MKLRLNLLLLIAIFCFSSCGKTKVKEQGTENDATEIVSEEVGEEIIDEAYLDDYDEYDEFLITVPFEMPKQEGVVYPEWTDVKENDSIAIPIWDENKRPVLLGKNLALGERWLCTTFFDAFRPWVAEYTDTLTTVAHQEIEIMYPIDVTTLMIDEKKFNRSLLDKDDSQRELEIDFDLAFRGDYVPSDLVRYSKTRALAKSDSVRITQAIQKTINERAIESPYNLFQPDYMTLRKMYGVKEDITLVAYEPSNGKTLASRSIMLLKGDKILLWDASEIGIRVEMFNLKGQNYLWVRKELSHASLWDVYKLNDDKLENVYQMMITD